MVALVDQMLALHKKLGTAKTAHETESLRRQIDATDRQIDELVYELYGLTNDDIRIVEAATAKCASRPGPRDRTDGNGALARTAALLPCWG